MTIFKKKTVIPFISSCLLLFLIAGVFAYRNLAFWLFLADPLPENLNYICTFAGSSDREPYSIQLLKIFKDAVWVVNTNNSQLKKWASQKEIDSNRIIITPKCNSTLEEINSFREIINRIELDSGFSNKPLIGFVSSPYHMRRISVLFSLSRNKCFQKGLFLPVPIERTSFSRDKLHSWWKDKHTRQIVRGEMKKMVGNIILKIPLIGNKIKELYYK
jgi:hypothetical protein